MQNWLLRAAKCKFCNEFYKTQFLVPFMSKRCVGKSYAMIDIIDYSHKFCSWSLIDKRAGGGN